VVSREGAVETVLSAALRLAWGFRLELTVAAVVTAVTTITVHGLGVIGGSLWSGRAS
jgi:hypothetical protein